MSHVSTSSKPTRIKVVPGETFHLKVAAPALTRVKVSATGVQGAPGINAWGTILGNLPNQADLKAELDSREFAGTAANLLAAHLADADPHSQYSTTAEVQALIDGGNFAAAIHGHAIADVVGLETALDEKENVGTAATALTNHLATANHLTPGDVQALIDGGNFAPLVHGHTVSDIAGLQTALDSKVDLTDTRLSDERIPLDASVTDDKIGDRTIDQTITDQPSHTGKLTQFLGWFAQAISAITGKTNWFDAPAISLESTAAHVTDSANPHGTTAAQVGADPLGSASAAIAAHLADADPHSQYTTADELSSAIAASKPVSTTPFAVARFADTSGNLANSNVTINNSGDLGVGVEPNNTKLAVATSSINQKGLVVSSAWQVNGYPLLELRAGSNLLMAQLDAFGRFYLNPGQLSSISPSTLDAAFAMSPRVVGAKAFVLRALAGQTGNLISVESSSATSLFTVGPTGDVAIASTTASTSTTNGAATIAGGLGVGGAANIGGDLTTMGLVRIGHATSLNNTIQRRGSDGATLISGPSAGGTPIAFVANGVTEFARFRNNNLLLGTTTDDGINRLQVSGSAAFSGNLAIASTTASTSPTNGAATIAGGLGVGGNANIGGNLAVTSGRIYLDSTNTKSLESASNNLTASGNHIIAGFGLWCRGSRMTGIDTGSGASNDLLLYTSGTERFRIGSVTGDFRNALPTPSATSATTSATAGTLAAGTYYYRVVALDSSGLVSLPSNEVSVALSGTNSATISFQTVLGSSNYRIYRGTTSGGQSGYFSISLSNANAGGINATATDSGQVLTTGTVPLIATGSIFNLRGSTGEFITPGCTIKPNGDVAIASTTASTAPTNGAATIAGGLGVGGNANIGGNLTVASRRISSGYTYDQSAVPSSPSVGETWLERSGTGLILGEWEWSGTYWLSPKTTMHTNPSGTSLVLSSSSGEATSLYAVPSTANSQVFYLRGFGVSGRVEGATNATDYWQFSVSSRTGGSNQFAIPGVPTLTIDTALAAFNSFRSVSPELGIALQMGNGSTFRGINLVTTKFAAAPNLTSVVFWVFYSLARP